MSMVVNTRLHSVICEVCKVAFAPCQAQGHLTGNHKDSHIKIDKVKFEKATTSLHVYATLSEVSQDVLAPQHGGLHLESGLGW